MRAPEYDLQSFCNSAQQEQCHGLVSALAMNHLVVGSRVACSLMPEYWAASPCPAECDLILLAASGDFI